MLESKRYRPDGRWCWGFVVNVTAYFSSFALAAVLAITAYPVTTHAQSPRELRASLESAKRQAAENKGLDAAYELVGIAEAAQKSAPDLAGDAVTTLNMVLARATQSALSAPIEDAQDTLDQLVDLSFFTRTSNISGADATLQSSLRILFPKLAGDVRMALSAANASPESFSNALTNLGVLGELQAAAMLMMLNDVAGPLAQAYDAEAARLENVGQQLADSSVRDKALADLAERRKIRDEQVKDAQANNLATVTAELAKPGRKAPADEESAEASSDAGEIAMTCVENGMIVPPSMSSNWEGLDEILPKIEEDCVLSGRLPTEDRCPMRGLSFVCRESLDEKSERLAYVYRDTQEERTMRENCKGERINAAQVPATGAVFKNTAMRRILSCVPVPSARGQD